MSLSCEFDTGLLWMGIAATSLGATIFFESPVPPLGMASLTFAGICLGCDFGSTQRGYAMSSEINAVATAATRTAPPVTAMSPPLQCELLDGFGQRLMDAVYASGVVCTVPYAFNDDAKTRLATASGKTSEITQNGAVIFNSYVILDVKPGTVLDIVASCTWQRTGINSKLTNFEVATSSAVTITQCLDGYEAIESRPGKVIQCRKCSFGKYLIGSSTEGCNDCPPGAVCKGGNDVVPMQDWWEPQQSFKLDPSQEPQEPHFYACPRPGSCPGGSSLNASALCSAGYTGLTCGLCADGYMDAGGICKPCSAGPGGVISPMAWAIMGVGALAALVAGACFFYDQMCTGATSKAKKIKQAIFNLASNDSRVESSRIQDALRLGNEESGSMASAPLNLPTAGWMTLNEYMDCMAASGFPSARDMLQYLETVQLGLELERENERCNIIAADMAKAQAALTASYMQHCLQIIDTDEDSVLTVTELRQASEHMAAVAEVAGNDQQVLQKFLGHVESMAGGSMDVVSLETFTSIVLGCQEGPGEEETRHTLKIMLKAIEALRQETQARKRFESEVQATATAEALRVAQQGGDAAAIEGAKLAHDTAMKYRKLLIASAAQTAYINNDVVELVRHEDDTANREEEEEAEEEKEEEEEEEEDEEEDEDEAIEVDGAEVDGGTDPIADLTAQLKVVTSQCQIAGSFPGAIEIEWPASFLVLAGMFASLKLDIAGEFGVGCVANTDYPNQLVMYIVGPVLIITALQLKLCVLKLCKQDFDDEKDGSKVTSQIQLLLFLCFPMCSQIVLKAFNCRWIEGHWYLVADLEMQCFTAQHLTIMMLGIVGTLMYPVGIMVYTYVRLTRSKHKLHSSSIMKAKYGSVYLRYEPQYYYWELTEMSRKLVLTSVVMYISPGSALQVVSAILCGGVFFVLHVKCQPFLDDADDNLQFASLLSTVLTLVGAVQLMAATPHDDPFKVMLFMVAVNVMVVSLAIYTAVTDTIPSIVEEYMGYIDDLKFAADKIQANTEGAIAAPAAQAAVVASSSALSPAVGVLSRCSADSEPSGDNAPGGSSDSSSASPPAVSVVLPVVDRPSSDQSHLTIKDTNNTTSTQCLSKKIDATLDKIFHRYDLDSSGTINDNEEMEQLTMSMVFAFQAQLISNDAINAKISKLQICEENALSQAEYAQWFKSNIAMT